MNNDINNFLNDFVNTTFYNNTPERINEVLFGKKYKMRASIANDDTLGGMMPQRFDVLLSKNTKPDERAYRITVFINKDPQGHIDITEEEASYILDNNILPIRVEDELINNGYKYPILSPEFQKEIKILRESFEEINSWIK